MPLSWSPCDTRLMIHGHTFLKWSQRTGKHVQNRYDNLTSVNYRIAMRDNAYGSLKQNDQDTGRFFLNRRKRHSETQQFHPAPPLFFWGKEVQSEENMPPFSHFFAFCANFFLNQRSSINARHAAADFFQLFGHFQSEKFVASVPDVHHAHENNWVKKMK